MRKSVSCVLFLCLVLESLAWAGLGSHDAKYIGGTASSLTEKSEGRTSIGEESFTFEHKGGKLAIPYKQITSIEYGQKAGRRVGMAVAVSPLLLFSKKRKHYLTIAYTDADSKQQAAVFELGKGVIRSTLTSLEAKTGRTIEYQDDEARKSVAGK